MRHQVHKGFHSIFVEIPHHQKGYLVYVPSTRNIISSYYVVFDESFPSILAYTSQSYAEAMDMRPDVSYIPCATSSKGKTGNTRTYEQFEYGDLLSETREHAERNDKSGDKYDDNSIMTPLLS